MEKIFNQDLSKYQEYVEKEKKLRASMTKEQYEEYCAKEDEKYLNNIVGQLGYINCPKCLNRGYMSFVVLENGEWHTKAKECECMSTRRIYRNLANCGIDSFLLDQSTFDNFKANVEWRMKFKSKVESYLNEFKASPNTFDKWLFISGLHGIGKTHLCTAVFKELILQGLTGKYLMWKDDIDKIKTLKKSSFTDNQEKLESIMKELKTVDVLYIDDFFKLMDNYSRNEELNIAYEILNARYNNNKITIISSELKKAEIDDLDGAIYGRIYQKCNGYWIELKYEPSRDYRTNKEEEI